jgi:Methyltransferase domain
MKNRLKALLERIAHSTMVHSFVYHLIYPSILKAFVAELHDDNSQASAAVAAIEWKISSIQVLRNELAAGHDCAEGRRKWDGQSRSVLLDRIMQATLEIPGDIVEFGVFKGESLRQFAALAPNRIVYGFDSFEGLPEAWWKHPKNFFKTEVPRFAEQNIRLVKGSFDATIPQFLSDWSGKIAIFHIDCDLYDSTLDCLIPLLPYCQPGTVVLFDEYYNYAGFEKHEWLAWQEVIQRFRLKVRCQGYDAMRAAFVITDGSFSRAGEGEGSNRGLSKPDR